MKFVCLAVVIYGVAIGQNPTAKVTFDVVSIKPGPPGTMMELIRSGAIQYRVGDTRADMGSITLSELIYTAYRMPWDVVGPPWLKDQQFDIHATFPAGATKEQFPEMLQSMLADRFRLVIHREQRVLPVDAMTVAKDGPKFRKSAAEDSVQCNGGFHKTCKKVTMEELARLLSVDPARMPFMASMPGVLDRPVADMTGLKGEYDFFLDYGVVGGGRGVDPTGKEIVTAFDAVKALGLKLEPTKHAFEVIVIDHIEKVPTENQP